MNLRHAASAAWKSLAMKSLVAISPAAQSGGISANNIFVSTPAARVRKRMTK
jgi:hypothetical protein